MAERKHSNRSFAIFITILVILLMLAIALFIYGSMTNGIPQLRLPGHPHFALGPRCWYG